MKTSISLYSSDEKFHKEFLDSGESVFEFQSCAVKPETFFAVTDLAFFLTHAEFFKDHPRQGLFIISPLSDEENMIHIHNHHIHHLVGLNDKIFVPEILSHIKRQLDKKFWGLDVLMEEGSDSQILSLNDSKNTNEMVTKCLMSFDFKDYFSSPIEYLQVMANELISNSLYKGPNKKRMEHGIGSVDRKSPVFLKGSELVQVTLAQDTKGVALSVQDSFGGLTYDLLISTLMRSFREKTVEEKKDGAGLGLYLTFLHSNQFIINFKENVRTEVICIIEKNKRYKNYKQRIRSFHYFQEVPSEKTHTK